MTKTRLFARDAHENAIMARYLAGGFTEPLRKIIFPTISTRSFISFATSCRQTYHFFKRDLHRLAASRLLNAVIYAHYDEAIKIATSNPMLMFQTAEYIHRNGMKGFISPLKYAFKMLDTKMWRSFQDILKSQAPDKMEMFLQHAREQTDFINLEPLFASYQHHQQVVEIWLEGQLSSRQCERAWELVGILQQLLIPYHMWIEFCSSGKLWNPTNQFSNRKLPQPLNYLIFDGMTQKVIPLKKIIDNDLGRTFTVVRGFSTQRISILPIKGAYYVGAIAGGFDALVLRNLYTVRINDFKCLLEPEFNPNVVSSTMKQVRR